MRYGVSDYLLKPVSAARLHEVLARLHEDLQKDSLQREREIIAGRLSGDGTVEELPSTLSSRRYGLHLVTVGNLPGQGGALKVDQIRYYWKKAALQEVVTRLSGPQDSWWLVDEPLSNGKMLITVLPCAPYGEILYSDLLGHVAGLFPVTVCSAEDAVPAEQIWDTARALRACTQTGLRPGLSTHLLQSQTALSMAAPGQDRDALKILSALVKANKEESAARVLAALVAAWKTAHLPQSVLETRRLELQKAMAKGGGTDELGARNLEKWNDVLARNTDEEMLYAELGQLLREALHQRCNIQNTSQELFEQVRQYIEEHYLEPITVDSMAEHFHFSTSYISRVFKKHAWQPPFRYLLSLRIREAQRLIRENDALNFLTVSEMTGFMDAHYFSRVFRSFTGLSPSAYRKANGGRESE